MSDFTRPEKARAWQEAHRLRGAIFREGGCTFCLHRIPGATGWAACSAPQPRAFPLCMKDRQKPSFDLDRDALEALNGSR